ncbi:TPA: tape measure protein [Mannheimia haemolytica]
MSSLGQLNISLTLESTKFQSALSKSDYEAQKFARNFVLNMDQATAKAKQFAQRTTDYLSNIEQAAKNINTATKWEFRFNNFDRVKNIASTYSKIADSYTELGNKLRLVTENETQHARAMADVYDISLKTAQSTQATSSVYQTFAQNAKQLGISQADVAKLTETVAKSVAVSGASSATASNALVQFSQSLLMGKMKAQEFNSLMTQTPSVVQAIAKGLGITTTELKAMVDNGEMTAEKMIEGLKKAESYVNGQYAKTTSTISGAMQNLSTATEKWVGEMDKAIGVSSLAATAINGLANNFSAIAPVLINAGLAFGAIRLTDFTKSTYNQITATRQQSLAIIEKTRAKQVETQKELEATRAYIASLQAQLNLTRVESSRALLSQELQVQTARETALIQAKTAATNTLATAAKSASILGGALNMLGGPIGLVTMGLTAGATVLWDWYQKAEQAREEALRYSDSLDTVRAGIEKMTKAQTDAEMVKLSRSIKEQETALANLKQRQAELTREIEQGATVYEDAFAGTVRVTMSAEELAKKQEELTLVTADAEKAQKTLNSSLEAQEALKAHIPIVNLREEFVKLYPHIDESQIKVDSLNLAIGNFTVKSPEMVIAANNIANALGGVAGEAMRAAILVANLSSMKLDANGAAIIDPKHLETIEQIERNNAIGSAKGKDKIALQVKDALIKSGMKEGDAGYERLKAAYEQQFTLQNAPKGGGKPKKTKAEKEAEKAAKKKQREKEQAEKKAQREAERSAESYQNQVAEMTNRLSGLKTDKEDLVKYGGISQYQEVRKLTEDIALNAEKYKNYGTEGVAKLKELAAKIDSEQQLLDIEQFQVDHDKKLEAMQFELDLLGKTRTEKELLQFNNQLDLEAERLKINMTKENIALLDQKIAKIKEEYELHQKKQEETRASVMMGIKEGWNNIETDVSNVAANVANITQNTFDGMADSLTNFVMTGKADFRSFAQSVLSDISKMLIKMALFNAIKQGMSFMGFSDGGLVGSSFAVGGYTGNGGKYTPAGIVHKGEYVITKEATSRLGLDYLNYLNYGRRGFASGGGVAVPRVPSSSYQPKSAQSSISVQLINNGEPVDAKVSQKQQGEQTQITVELMRKIARQEANGMIQNNFRAGGVFA